LNAKLVFLGTGTAVPVTSRGLPCIALRLNGDIYLFDVGEGCQEKLFKAGLGVVKVKAAFITHLHGDHFYGIFGLLHSMNMMRKTSPLSIVTPLGLEKMLDSVIVGWRNKLGFTINLTYIDPWITAFNDGNIVVKPYPVLHNTPQSYGYIVELKNGRKIVYTGDTLPCRSTVEACSEADVLIHESTFLSNMSSEAHSQMHSTSGDAGYVASLCNPRLLILTHISARYSDEYPLFIDAYRFFKNTLVARDYMTVAI